MDAYISNQNYHRLVAALAAIEPCALTGDKTAYISEALGEIGGIWPVTVLNDAPANRAFAPNLPA